MMTSIGVEIPNQFLANYLTRLVGQFFKILPIKESGEPSIKEYMCSLQREIIGCCAVMQTSHDSMWVSLISILQFLIDNECDIATVKTEVFKAISLCKKLKIKYQNKGA